MIDYMIVKIVNDSMMIDWILGVHLMYFSQQSTHNWSLKLYH